MWLRAGMFLCQVVDMCELEDQFRTDMSELEDQFRTSMIYPCWYNKCSV